MESPEKSAAGAGAVKKTTTTTVVEEPAAGGVGPDAVGKAQQQTGAPGKTEGGGDKPQPPPLFDKPVHTRSGARYSALAATAFARFDASDRQPQLAELYKFRDRSYARRGYI